MNVLGLRVESVVPGIYATSININSELSIVFNSELNTRTIPGNILVLKDIQSTYTIGTDINLNSYDHYEIIEGAISYKDKKIIFKPTSQLDMKSRYIIYVKKESVSDILGNSMLTDFISYFTTEEYESYAPTNITEPVNNSIISSLERVVIENVDSYRYILQISKSPTFENIFVDEIVDSNIVERDFGLGDGLFYIRAKAENGSNYGTVSVFSIKTYASTVTTDEDIDDNYIYEPFEEQILELLMSYPELDSINNSVKTNLMYMKFNELIPLEDIDFYESEVVGAFIDEDDSFGDSSIVAHGQLDGSFIVVYDEEKSETYIFFSPDSM